MHTKIGHSMHTKAGHSMHTKAGHSMHQVECVFGIYFEVI